MNFGFRYHLASLMAVFFSLILGILIGGALFPDHALVDEQALLISELEQRFGEVHADLALVQAELDLSAFAWSQLLEVITKDRLAAKTVIFVDSEAGDGGSLMTVLQSSGAEVKEMGVDQIAGVIPNEDMFFVFSLSEHKLPSQTLATIQELAQVGANLAFAWDTTKEPSLDTLPPSLQIDNIDTSWGELALILGLSAGSQGHYGTQKSATRLFP